jgi:hypothetical protein
MGEINHRRLAAAGLPFMVRWTRSGARTAFVAVACAIAACSAGQAESAPPVATLQAGWTPHADTEHDFFIGLPPGWTESTTSAVDFFVADAPGGGKMWVVVESTDIDKFVDDLRAGMLDTAGTIPTIENVSLPGGPALMSTTSSYGMLQTFYVWPRPEGVIYVVLLAYPEASSRVSPPVWNEIAMTFNPVEASPP